MSLEQIPDLRFQLRDMYNCHVENLVVSVSAIPFDNHDWTITTTWFAERNPTDTLTENKIVEHNVGKAVKEGLRQMLWDKRHRDGSNP